LIINVNGIYARYEDKEVLHGISVNLESGKLTGLIGPNGSGKSTLLKCIYRVLDPFKGAVLIDGKDVSRMSYLESAKKVSVLAQQHSNGFDFKVQDVVLMGRTPYKGIMEGDNEEDYRISREAMEATGIARKADSSFADLSGGEQQRVMLARALTQQTPCLILDEPTNHLDITYQLQIMNLVSSQNLTVIAAIHDLNIAAMYCDRIIAMKDGSLVADGTPQEVLTTDTIWKLYHVKSTIIERNDGRPAIIFERGPSC